jgi:nucleoside 2-deoxyribosyltransferase
MSTEPTYTYYFAGELFDFKHLTGNVLLADAIEKLSAGRYKTNLPQDLEQREVTPHHIRDQDILTLLESDLGVFNYDGPELDSGTVVEYLFAKFADIPSVLLRTDFRGGGDQEHFPWNLMTSFFPRTEVLLFDALSVYKRKRAELSEDSHAASTAMVQEFAEAVIGAFDKVLKEPPVMPSTDQETLFRWLSTMSNFGETFPNAEELILKAMERKQHKGLL